LWVAAPARKHARRKTAQPTNFTSSSQPTMKKSDAYRLYIICCPWYAKNEHCRAHA
jgi:hypothetical protein